MIGCRGPWRWRASLAWRGVRACACISAPTAPHASRPLAATAGSTVIREGDVGDRFFIIKEGEATVLQAGREVNRLFRSDFFGEQALLKDEPR